MTPEHKDETPLRKRRNNNLSPCIDSGHPDSDYLTHKLYQPATSRRATGRFHFADDSGMCAERPPAVDTACNKIEEHAKQLRWLQRVQIDSRRAFDILVAAVALVATSPILVLACAAMALTMHWKVFFLQQRYGKHGRRFTLIKLRSLRDVPYKDASGQHQRLTPISRIVRRFGVDELPQFFNVLKGDMSIFGPRPFDIEPNVDGWCQRYAIKPGLIGLASVREKISGSESPLEKVVKDDLEYICQRTWKIDAWLLIMAVVCIFTGRIDPQEQITSNNRICAALNRLALSTIS